MAFEGFEEEEHALSQINITPLVDVAMVLLIIFMITAPMMIQGADVRLPETRPMDALPPEAVIVAVQKDGTVLVNEVLVEIDDLEQRLSQMALEAGREVHLWGDFELQYGTVIQVMEHISRAGLAIGLVTQPIPEQRP